MKNSLQKNLDNSKADTSPRELIIHSPRVEQRAQWDEWAASTVAWLVQNGWTASRIGHRVHVRPAFLDITVH